MRFLRGAFIICVLITIWNFKHSLYAKSIDSLIAKAERLEKSEKFKAAYKNATKALGHINESTSEKEILRVYELVLRLAWEQNLLNDTEAHARKLLENYSGPEIDFLGYRYLGHAYMELGNLEKAIENYHRALSEGNGGTEEANIHFNLGALYQELDNVDDSVLSYKKAIQILKVQDDSKEELSFVFFNLGLVQEINSDYASAFSSYQQCIELIKSNSLDHAFLVDAIDRICTVSKLIKKHEECLKFLRFKRKLILDSDEKDVIKLLKINFSISEIFYYQNRYKDALNEIEKVFIQKELFKKTDFDFYGDIILNITAYLLELHRPYEVINILNQEINDFTGDSKLISDWYATLGISYFYLKDYNNSEKVLLKAIELVETSEDETPALNAYHTLCGVYSRIGKFDKANEAVQNYIDKSLKFYGKLSEDYAHALFQKSIISLELENLDEGISITKRVIQLYNEIHGNQNIYNLIPYRNLAMAFYIKEEYKNSKESLISSMEIISKQKQFDHPDAIYCYDFYAELLVIEKNFTEAINFSRKANENFLNYLNQSYEKINEIEFSRTLVSLYEERNPFDVAIFSEDPKYILETLSRYKGLTFDYMLKKRDSPQTNGELFEPYRISQKKNQVLIDYIKYYDFSDAPDDSSRYGCIARYWQNGTMKVEWFNLGKSKAIDQAIEQLQTLTTSKSGNLSNSLVFLNGFLIEPILKSIPPHCDSLIICPDSDLCFVPFSVLIDEERKFLCEKYSIYNVSVSRDLSKRSRALRSKNAQILVYANPNFLLNDQNVNQVASLSNLPLKDFRNFALSNLNGAEEEAFLIGEISSKKGLSSEIKIGSDATEQSISNITSPEILHLATHGWFMGDNELNRFNRRGSFSKKLNIHNEINPMDRSGLALSGAKSTLLAWENKISVNPSTDGILTANEASKLDLHDTWLTVLSACETGSGVARDGEGVLGLRRAFAMAGTQNLLLTLWPVSDSFTKDFMVSFYEEALESGNAPKAMAKVQRDWLVRLREERSISQAVKLAGPFVLTFRGNPELN